MLIKQFIEMVKSDSNGTMNFAKVLETKQYLPFAEKISLVNRIVDKCMTINNGFVQFNEIDQYIYFTIESIQAYTNLKFDEDHVVDYDLLCSTGLLGNIIATFDGEYKMILNLVEMQKRYVLEQNKIEFQVAKVANALVDAIDKFGDTLSGKVNELEKLATPENMQMFVEFMNTFK